MKSQAGKRVHCRHEKGGYKGDRERMWPPSRAEEHVLHRRRRDTCGTTFPWPRASSWRKPGQSEGALATRQDFDDLVVAFLPFAGVSGRSALGKSVQAADNVGSDCNPVLSREDPIQRSPISGQSSERSRGLARPITRGRNRFAATVTPSIRFDDSALWMIACSRSTSSTSGFCPIQRSCFPRASM